MTKEHYCDAIVVSCIDFRFQEYIRKWTDENLDGKKFDYVGFAGASKNLPIILEQVDISHRLHRIKQVILVHHEDCGAYGEQGTKQRHIEDMNKAQKDILERHPDLQVDLYFLHLNGEFERIGN